jgi:hypothetical protein
MSRALARCAAAAARPAASAARSTRLTVSRIPARPSSSPAARPNGTAAPAIAAIAARPGDIDRPATSSSASLGARPRPCFRPRLHRAQWYQARRSRTSPTTVSTTLPR